MYDQGVCALFFKLLKSIFIQYIKKEQKNALPNGLLCLKGGELQQEIAPVKKTSIVFNLSDYFKEDYFDTKKVVYVQIVKR